MVNLALVILIMKQFDGFLENSNNKIYGFCIALPESVAEWFLKRNIKRVVCTLNDTHSWQCAIMPMGQSRYYVLVNSQLRKKLKLLLNEPIKVKLEEDKSKYGMPMPEEMKELLYQDPEGEHLFHALTPGKQRSLLHLIGKPKSSELKLIKALVVLEHLKKLNGKLDFKILNEDMKNNRFKNK